MLHVYCSMNHTSCQCCVNLRNHFVITRWHALRYRPIDMKKITPHIHHVLSRNVSIIRTVDLTPFQLLLDYDFHSHNVVPLSNTLTNPCSNII